MAYAKDLTIEPYTDELAMTGDYRDLNWPLIDSMSDADPDSKSYRKIARRMNIRTRPCYSILKMRTYYDE
jgi:hypothetical protein